MKTVAYLRVSTQKQDEDNQELAILKYCSGRKISVDETIRLRISSTKSRKLRKIDQLLKILNPGDRLIVSELSRLGRSTGEVIRIIDDLHKNGVEFHAIKQGIEIKAGSRDMQGKVMVTVFSLIAELERDLLSERTKMGLELARQKGKALGRPKGSTGKSKLDRHAEEIQDLYQSGVTMTSLSRRFNVVPSTMAYYIKKRPWYST